MKQETGVNLQRLRKRPWVLFLGPHFSVFDHHNVIEIRIIVRNLHNNQNNCVPVAK